jgi:hypothetical protein
VVIRRGDKIVRGFALGADDSVDALVASKLSELGYGSVSDFQKAKGLTVDGVAGHDTLTAMGLGYLFDLSSRGMLSSGQTQLETKNTPLTPEQAAQALSEGYQSITGSVPSPDVLSLLLAQSGHETANWQKLPNYAFGGVKATSGTPYVQAFVTPEGDPPKHYVLAFAAYPTAAAGAKAYIRTLKNRSAWWDGLQSGVPQTFVDALVSIPGALYFTGNAGDYLASMQTRVQQFADLAKEYARPLARPAQAAAAVVAPYIAPIVQNPKRALAVAAGVVAVATAAAWIATRRR